MPSLLTSDGASAFGRLAVLRLVGALAQKRKLGECPSLSTASLLWRGSLLPLGCEAPPPQKQVSPRNNG
ncbi:hypothetical protein SAMN03159307_01436 [Pseudomonas sp. NFACC46-3]|nr:hypothetical protein SAMN03159307_01436 [Pseudomonas sp. NFACC46-3]